MITNTLISKHKNSIKIAVLAAFTGFFGILLLASNYSPFQGHFAHKIGKSASKAEQLWANILNENHEKALEAIRVEFNIPQDEWQKTMDEFATIKAQADYFCTETPVITKTGDPITDRVLELLAQAGINPEKVTIKFTSGTVSPIKTVQDVDENNQIYNTMYIDKQWLTSHPQNVQDAIVKHETVHLHHLDSIKLAMVRMLLVEYGITGDAYKNNKAVQNVYHSCELRADLLAAAGDITTAQAFQQDFKDCMAKGYEEDIKNHPPIATRYDEMSKLVSYLEAEQNTQLA